MGVEKFGNFKMTFLEDIKLTVFFPFFGHCSLGNEIAKIKCKGEAVGLELWPLMLRDVSQGHRSSIFFIELNCREEAFKIL